MPDVDAIIEQILAASRAKGGRAFATSRTYADEPILLRGSQLASYLPEPLRKMRTLARRPEARAWSDARLFVEQARLMADYEDNAPYEVEFKSYFPTYEAMTNPQLRGYFTWRAHVRQGQVERTSLSFAFVYLYELINGIGTTPGTEAFHAIEAFWQAYRSFEPALDRYVRPWLVDYVVYYDLPAELAQPYLNTAHDRAVAVLAHAEERATRSTPTRGRRFAPRSYERNPQLFAALDMLSTYRLGDSRLHQDDPDAVEAVSCAVFSQLARYYQRSRSQGITGALFGTRHAMPHLMFASAVFYPGTRHPDGVYELDETCRYTCQNGMWTCDALHDGGARSAKLGQILHAVDQRLREALNYPHPLKDRGDPKYLIKIINREIQDYLAWRAAHEPRRIDIDLSKLEGIRATAAVTREALLVDEEREDAATEPPAASSDESDEKASALLTADEEELLQDLLAGRPPASDNVDLLVDSINEKLYDLLGDTALEFDESGAPSVVEDYAEDVGAILSQK